MNEWIILDLVFCSFRIHEKFAKSICFWFKEIDWYSWSTTFYYYLNFPSQTIFYVYYHLFICSILSPLEREISPQIGHWSNGLSPPISQQFLIFLLHFAYILSYMKRILSFFLESPARFSKSIFFICGTHPQFLFYYQPDFDFWARRGGFLHVKRNNGEEEKLIRSLWFLEI